MQYIIGNDEKKNSLKKHDITRHSLNPYIIDQKIATKLNRKTAKIGVNISSAGEFDESIISVFNILFESVLFRFFSFFISFLELFYFNCKLFNSWTNISKIESWSKRKVIWSWFEAKIWRFCTNLSGVVVPRNGVVVPSRFHGQTPTREVGTAPASSGTTVRDPQTSFCFFSLLG